MIIGFIIWSIVAIVFLAIGFSCRRSHEPAGFFTFVKPPAVKNVEEYNKENSPVKSRKDQLVAAWCGCIMIVATILFFIAGLGYEMWEKCWIVYPIGGMLCGIVTLILNGRYRE